MTDDKWKEVVIKLDTKMDIITERFDRHFEETRSSTKAINEKLDSFTQKIHQVEVSSLKETGQINIKLATLMGGIAILVEAVWHGLKAIWK